MDKIFIIEIEWYLKGDAGHEILAVTTADNVKKCFKHFVDQEKSESYLEEFFNTDGTLKDGIIDELEDYTDTDTSFVLTTKDYEYYTELSIIEKTIWNGKE